MGFTLTIRCHDGLFYWTIDRAATKEFIAGSKFYAAESDCRRDLQILVNSVSTMSLADESNHAPKRFGRITHVAT
jgi:hypothetical protein